jgi:predicted dienelactone hydrolase
MEPLPMPRLHRFLAALLLTPAPLLAAPGAAFRALHVTDPVGGSTMPGYVFYPTEEAGKDTRVGPYDVAATFDAPPRPGAKPLVVLSHGNAGTALGHHDLATFLAAHGFVVATIEHPRDNFHDTSGVGQAAVLVGRPIQVKATIGALLADPQWKPLIDPARIGVAGFSAGGYTSLLLVGAVPRFRRFIDYCRRYAADALCAEAPRMEAEAKRQGRSLEQLMDDLQAGLTRWGPTADPRVKAAFAMAPLSLVFDEAGAGAIDRPVFLYYGDHDRVLRPNENAARLAPLVPTLVGLKPVAGADHWVFIPPCSPELAKDDPMICADSPGVSRAALHAQIEADALSFFRATLHVAPQ